MRLKINFPVDISFGCILTRNNAAWIAQDDGMAGDVAVHICTRGNEDIVTDRNASDDDGVNADPHAVSQNGRAFSLAAVLLTYSRTFMQVAVRANDGGFVNRNVEGVS